MQTAIPTPAAPPAAHLTEKRYLLTLVFVTSPFMLRGIAITMGDVLNRHFQNVLHVSKAQSGLVRFSIFGAYAVMGIPAGLFMKRFGYKNGLLPGLYTIGGAVFPPLMGLVANHDVAAAYYLPIACYLVIFLFGTRLYKVSRQ